MAGDRCLSIDCFQLFKRQKEKVMGGCHLKSRFGEKLQLGKNKSFVVLKDTITIEKNAYSILFCFDEEVPNSIISDVSQTTEKESYTITLMKKKGESRIKNSLSSIGRSIQYAFSKANEQGFTKIFIDEPKDLISKDITFILQQFIRMLLYFDAKRSFPQIKSIYFDWSGVDMKELIKKVEKDLSRI